MAQFVKGDVMKKNIPLLFLLFFFIKVPAQNKIVPLQLCPDELKWNPTKPPLAPGAKVTVLEGNPKDTGHFTMRVKMPPHYLLRPHTHPVDERTTVISGSVNIALDEAIDSAKTKKLTAGCFYVNPANAAHYLYTNETEAVVQISTNGPWGFKFLEK
jgi:quercetin dioxygenase-like cupin family protein